jgi:uncharacterized secreted protein with C-terminal beta-propeller domain
MASESRPRVRPTIVAAVAAGALIAGFGANCATRPPPRASSSLRLVAYDDCGSLLTGLRKATTARVGPYGLGIDPIMRPLADGRVPGDAKAADKAQEGAAAQPYSTTNVQEPGVDEPDLVKTDGRRIVTVARGRLHVIDAASRKETGSLDLAAGASWSAGQLLLGGDRVLVVMPPAMTFVQDDIASGFRAPRDQGPRVILVDIKGAPRVVSSMRVDGTYVDARQVGSVARLVVRSAPHIDFPQRRGGSDADATAANRRTVERAPVDAWLPHYSVTRDGRTENRAVPCDRVSHPPSYSGTSLVSVLSVDLTGDMADAAPVSVLAGGQTVYGSGSGLYVTDRPDVVPGGPLRKQAAPSRTDIYQFDLSRPGPPAFTASGSVPGDLLSQYSLSEYAGRLRVATTSGSAAEPVGRTASPTVSPTASPTVSSVYVLARRGTSLTRVGRVDGLGRGERIYAVRFAGPVGYVVTFRQTDPLYVLDLRDPAKPRTTGELKISGYSAYLHPAGDGRLIGVGQQTDAQGRPQGTQVSLFDVHDPAAPRKLAGYTAPSAWSAVEGDPHAFLYWPRTGLTVLPMGGTDGTLVLTVTTSSVHRTGTVRTPQTRGPVQRALVVGDTLWTLSPAGLQANDATTLAKTAWVAF